MIILLNIIHSSSLNYSWAWKGGRGRLQLRFHIHYLIIHLRKLSGHRFCIFNSKLYIVANEMQICVLNECQNRSSGVRRQGERFLNKVQCHHPKRGVEPPKPTFIAPAISKHIRYQLLTLQFAAFGDSKSHLNC